MRSRCFLANLGSIFTPKKLMVFVFYALQTISYMAERVVGTGSFGIVFQVRQVIFLDVTVLVPVYLSYTILMIFSLRPNAWKLVRLWL